MLKLYKPTADVYIAQEITIASALARTTHLGIGAHADDLEFMAFHGILQCYQQRTQWFTGVTCTNGAGSSRAGVFANTSDEDLCKIRRTEQRNAAHIGHYSAMLQLDYASDELKGRINAQLVHDLSSILHATQPEIVYTHNLADKHDSHIAVAMATLHALRHLAPHERPKQVIGCEIWRDLDWLDDKKKVFMDVSGREHLAAALNGVFDSQIAGGKRYDLAIAGRRRANATFNDSHSADAACSAIIGMDLTPAMNERCDIADFVGSLIADFERDVRRRLNLTLTN